MIEKYTPGDTSNQPCFLREMTKAAEATDWEAATTTLSLGKADVLANKRICMACSLGVRDVMEFAIAGEDASKLREITERSGEDCVLREPSTGGSDYWPDESTQTF